MGEDVALTGRLGPAGCLFQNAFGVVHFFSFICLWICFLFCGSGGHQSAKRLEIFLLNGYTETLGLARALKAASRLGAKKSTILHQCVTLEQLGTEILVSFMKALFETILLEPICMRRNLGVCI